VRRYGFILFFAGSLFGLVARYYAQQWGGPTGLLAYGEIWVVGGLIASVLFVWRERLEDRVRVPQATHSEPTDPGEDQDLLAFAVAKQFHGDPEKS